MASKLFKAARIFTPPDLGRPLAGGEMGSLLCYDPGALLCRDGLIAAVGPQDEVLALSGAREADQVVDCRGAVMLPGLVDPHTHACFIEAREAEFGQRIGGVSYLDILAGGGGILNTVQSVRAAGEDELLAATLAHLNAAMRTGTTSMEIKSGYGLGLEHELKMLRVIGEAGRLCPLTVAPTFMGAHAVPPEYKDDPDSYVDAICREMIPRVARLDLARFCDVFCEKGVFGLEQTRRILDAAKAAGLAPKLHADEVHDLGGAALAAEVGAVSAEHLLAAGDEGIKAMAAAGVVAVLLPGTAFCLQKPYARARDMIAMGLAVALATDLNPGSCYMESMPLVMALAVLNMGMSPEEALCAATVNAAHACGLGQSAGCLAPGRMADLILTEGQGPAALAFHPGGVVVRAVYKLGERLV